MRKRLAWKLSLISITLFASAVCAIEQDKHIIVAAELSGLFSINAIPNSNQPHGAYYQLLEQILQQSHLAARYHIAVMPMLRAKQMFLTRQAACYAPGLDTYEATEQASLPKNVISSQPINRALVRVLSRDSNRLIHSPADISKQDRVSAVRGVPISADMTLMMQRAGSSFLVPSELENLKLLQSGRVDFVMAFYPDVIFAYRELGIVDPYPYASDYTPLQIIDNVLCHAEHATAVALINAKLQQFSSDGTLARILGDYYLAAPQ